MHPPKVHFHGNFNPLSRSEQVTFHCTLGICLTKNSSSSLYNWITLCTNPYSYLIKRQPRRVLQKSKSKDLLVPKILYKNRGFVGRGGNLEAFKRTEDCSNNSSECICNCRIWKCLWFIPRQPCRFESMRPAAQSKTGPTKELFILCPSLKPIRNVLCILTRCRLTGFTNESTKI